jgi:hypothetical protein
MRDFDKAIYFTVLGACLGGCSVSPRQGAYYNPIDKKTYVAAQGWETYKPEGQTSKSSKQEKVTIDHIRLMTAQSDIAARTSADDMAIYIKEVERIAVPLLSATKKPYQLLVQFDCTPLKDKIKMAFQGEADTKALQTLSDALKKVKKLPVKSDEVSFQIQFTISP